MQIFGLGFAARCEEWLRPSVQVPTFFGCAFVLGSRLLVR
jgi:hypothetical protein